MQRNPAEYQNKYPPAMADTLIGESATNRIGNEPRADSYDSARGSYISFKRLERFDNSILGHIRLSAIYHNLILISVCEFTPHSPNMFSSPFLYF